jgi:hypothetical protein
LPGFATFLEIARLVGGDFPFYQDVVYDQISYHRIGDESP